MQQLNYMENGFVKSYWTKHFFWRSWRDATTLFSLDQETAQQKGSKNGAKTRDAALTAAEQRLVVAQISGAAFVPAVTDGDSWLLFFSWHNHSLPSQPLHSKALHRSLYCLTLPVPYLGAWPAQQSKNSSNIWVGLLQRRWMKLINPFISELTKYSTSCRILEISSCRFWDHSFRLAEMFVSLAGAATQANPGISNSLYVKYLVEDSEAVPAAIGLVNRFIAKKCPFHLAGTRSIVWPRNLWTQRQQ